MTNERALRCFLSRSENHDATVDAVATLLHQLGIEVSVSDDFDPRQVLVFSILSTLRSVDFVCAVFTDAPPSAHMAFELGLAVGIGKPVLALSRSARVPYGIGEAIQVLRLAADDITPVLSEVRRFVRDLTPDTQSLLTLASPDRTTVGTAAAGLSQARSAGSSRKRCRALVDVVAHLFAQPETEVIRRDSIMDDRPGLILQSDTLFTQLGGALIIACAYYRGHSGSVLAKASHTLQQLEKYVEKSSAGLGLLVLDHDAHSDLNLNLFETPYAMAFHVDDLIESAGAGKLNEELWRRRAQAMRLKEHHHRE